MAKILVTGGSGFLGTKLMSIYRDRHDVVGTSSGDREGFVRMNLEDPYEVDSVVRSESPDFVVHVGAMSKPLACEQHPEKAFSVNTGGTLFVAGASCAARAKLVYISTSYVFDGKQSLHEAYTETDTPHPINTYGQSKLMGESANLVSLDMMILRVPKLYGYNGKGHPNDLMARLESDEPYVADPTQVRSVLWTEDLAAVMERLMDRNASGIFHVASGEKVGIYDLCSGLELAVRNERLTRLATPEEIKRFDDGVPRPKHDFLDNSLVRKTTGFEFTVLEDAVKEIKRQRQS